MGLPGRVTSAELLRAQVSVLQMLRRLAFVRRGQLKEQRDAADPADFLVPPAVLLSLLALIRRHLPDTAGEADSPAQDSQSRRVRGVSAAKGKFSSGRF